MKSINVAAGVNEPDVAGRGRSGNHTEVKTAVLIAARAGSHRATLAAFLAKRGHGVLFADNQADAIALAIGGGVDMVITGHTMPGIDGYVLAKHLRDARPELPVILMSAGGAVLGSGLMDCVAALGSLSLAKPAVAGHAGMSNAAAEILARLTPREREVLDLVSSGHANKAVARLLSISPRTVENHRAQIMRKTNSRCVADLVRLSLVAGRAAMAAITG